MPAEPMRFYQNLPFKKIADSPIKELVITNTVFLPEEKQIDKIKSLSVAPLFADAIVRVQTDHSVSELFD